MVNHRVDATTRWKVMREQVLALRQIWTHEVAGFHGQYVDFDPILLWPKPVQPGGPPVLVAGQGGRALTRAVEYGDSWFPVVDSVDDLQPYLAELERLCEEAGRERLPIIAGLWNPDEALIERCAELGIARCSVWAPVGQMDIMEPFVERLARVAERYPET